MLVVIALGAPEESAIRRATPPQLRVLGAAAGSMTPKIAAARRFVEAGGRIGAIGALDEAAAILGGEAGTVVVADGAPDPAGSASTGGGMAT